MSLAQGIDILSKQAAWLKECFPHPHGPRGVKDPGRVCGSGGWVPGGTFLGRCFVDIGWKCNVDPWLINSIPLDVGYP